MRAGILAKVKGTKMLPQDKPNRLEAHDLSNSIYMREENECGPRESAGTRIQYLHEIAKRL